MSLSEDETSSSDKEDFLDAFEEKEKSNTFLGDFYSALCFPDEDDDSISDLYNLYQNAEYSQNIETRIMLNNRGKCELCCKKPNNVNEQKKLKSCQDDDVLVCKLARSKGICLTCGKTTPTCSCLPSRKRTTARRCNKEDNMRCRIRDCLSSKRRDEGSREIFSLLNELVTPASKNAKKNTLRTRSRTQQKCFCSEEDITPSSDKHFLNTVRSNLLTETLKQKICINCKELLGACNCAELRAAKDVSKFCIFCGKLHSECYCDFNKQETEHLSKLTAHQPFDKSCHVCGPWDGSDLNKRIQSELKENLKKIKIVDEDKSKEISKFNKNPRRKLKKKIVKSEDKEVISTQTLEKVESMIVEEEVEESEDVEDRTVYEKTVSLEVITVSDSDNKMVEDAGPTEEVISFAKLPEEKEVLPEIQTQDIGREKQESLPRICVLPRNRCSRIPRYKYVSKCQCKKKRKEEEQIVVECPKLQQRENVEDSTKSDQKPDEKCICSPCPHMRTSRSFIPVHNSNFRCPRIRRPSTADQIYETKEVNNLRCKNRICLHSHPIMRQTDNKINNNCRTLTNISLNIKLDKEQQCNAKKSLTSSCVHSQTGGTFLQDLIAKFVTSCSTNNNFKTPQPHQEQNYVIQSLLCPFPGDEVIKSGQRSSLEGRRCRNSDFSGLSLGSSFCSNFSMLRSVEVQAGSRCETAKKASTPLCQTNYICGFDVPGIRTKLKMKQGSTSSFEDCRSEESSANSDSCDTPVCSYLNAKFRELAEKEDCGKPTCKIMKKGKYIFITVTPVQTEPCEPNYFVILSTANDEKKSEKKSDKRRKNEMLNNQKEILSIETMRSKELMELATKNQKKPKGSIRPPCGTPTKRKNDNMKSCSRDVDCSALFKKMQMLDGDDEKLKNAACGPDTSCPFSKRVGKDASDAVTCEKDTSKVVLNPCDKVSKKGNKAVEAAATLEDRGCDPEICKRNDVSLTCRIETKEVRKTTSGYKRKQDNLEALKRKQIVNSKSGPDALIDEKGSSFCTEKTCPNMVDVICGPDTCTNDTCDGTQTETVEGFVRKKTFVDCGVVTQHLEDFREAVEAKDVIDCGICTLELDDLADFCYEDEMTKPSILVESEACSCGSLESLMESTCKIDINIHLDKTDIQACMSNLSSIKEQLLECNNQEFLTKTSAKREVTLEERCEDEVCPQKKTTKETIVMAQETVEEECENVLCSKKAATILNSRDFFAFEKAVDKFYRAKPSLSYDE